MENRLKSRSDFWARNFKGTTGSINQEIGLLFSRSSLMLFLANFTRIFCRITSGILLGEKKRWHSSSVALMETWLRLPTALHSALQHSHGNKKLKFISNGNFSIVSQKTWATLRSIRKWQATFATFPLFSTDGHTAQMKSSGTLRLLWAKVPSQSNECYDNQLRKTLFRGETDWSKRKWEAGPA